MTSDNGLKPRLWAGQREVDFRAELPLGDSGKPLRADLRPYPGLAEDPDTALGSPGAHHGTTAQSWTALAPKS